MRARTALRVRARLDARLGALGETGSYAGALAHDDNNNNNKKNNNNNNDNNDNDNNNDNDHDNDTNSTNNMYYH